MERFEQRTIEVFQACQNRLPIAYALSEAELTKVLTSKKEKTEIARRYVQAGVVTGEVLDWSKHGGSSHNPKLHWVCPGCHQKWWEDFFGNMANPYLAGSGCKCVEWWLVTWDPSQVALEIETTDRH